MRAALVLVVLVAAALVHAESLAGYKVVRADIETPAQLAAVKAWELDVWSRDSSLGLGLNDIRVNADHMIQLLAMGVQFDILIPDVEEHLAEGQRDLEESRKGAIADFFTAYHTAPEIEAYLINASTTFKSLVKYTPSIGKSIQGRDIASLILTGTASGSKKKLLFIGGQHAREWVGPITVLYIIDQLLSGYPSNPTVKTLLDSTELHFIPLANPDGYIYTWSGSSARLWRKNRRLNTGGTYGVDLNRNWNDHFGGEGSSGTPSSDTYRGTAAFSEPESKAVSDYTLANGPFVGAIDYHSYSQLILRPYGWTKVLPPNEAIAKTIGDGIRASILAVNRVAYTSQPSWELYYTAGTSTDWWYATGKIPFSYCIELRDTGTYGFQLPAAQIKPTGAENWAGFTYFVQTVLANSAN